MTFATAPDQRLPERVLGIRRAGAGRPVRNLAMVGLTAVYSLCFVAIKAGLAFAPPLLFAGLRPLLGSIVLLVLLAALRRPLLPGPGGWRWVAALGVTTTTIAFAAMFLSPGRTGAGIASVLGNTQPIMAVALAVPLLGEPLTRWKLTTVGLGAVGVLLIAYPDLAGRDAHGISGPALALGASLALTIGSVVAKRMGDRRDLLAITAWQLLAGSLPLLALSSIVEPHAAVQWNLRFLAILAFLGIAGTALPTPLWYWLLQRDEVGHLTLFLFLVPAFGLGIAALAFGERLGLPELVGLSLILLGILMLGLAGNQPRVHESIPRPAGEHPSGGPRR